MAESAEISYAGLIENSWKAFTSFFNRYKSDIIYDSKNGFFVINVSSDELLEFLKLQNTFVQILHPALPESAGYRYWKQVCQNGHSAGLISVIFKPEYELADVRTFCDNLKLFKLGFSWGGPLSLVMIYDLKDMRQLKNTHLQTGLLVRFCIGLEHPEDLIQDIENALKQLPKQHHK